MRVSTALEQHPEMQCSLLGPTELRVQLSLVVSRVAFCLW